MSDHNRGSGFGLAAGFVAWWDILSPITGRDGLETIQE